MTNSEPPRPMVRDTYADRSPLASRLPPPAQIADSDQELPGWHAPSFDGWSLSRPLNAEIPSKVPTRVQGSLPVIVHLVWETHEEMMPARAIRWNDTHVMVSIDPIDGPANSRELVTWLRAGDVFRTVPRRPRPG